MSAPQEFQPKQLTPSERRIELLRDRIAVSNRSTAKERYERELAALLWEREDEFPGSYQNEANKVEREEGDFSVQLERMDPHLGDD